MLEIVEFPDHESVSHAASDVLFDRIHARRDLLLCLATGATPKGTYERLAQLIRAHPYAPDQFRNARVLKLDEWGGIPMSSPATCETFLQETLIRPLAWPNYIAFESEPADPSAECARVAKWLREHGPIDVCVLGLGLNGHLGFNEPAPFLQPHAHVAELSKKSLQHSMIAGLPKLPGYGLTLGMADLLQSREILLLVTGASKREALQRLLVEKISPDFPASFLHLHPRVRVLCDAAACGGKG